jgi:predicted phage terminase large subunit-like protein|tara:strand:- start:8100 stop:9692 length:1593 start_codon:yes stop_codon:yes gene_type:complete
MINYTEEERDAATRLAIDAARADLLAFVLLMDPEFSPGPHHRIICDELMRLEKGEVERLMIWVAPRSSKSLIASVYYPAWAIGKHAAWQLLTVSHSSELATSFGKAVRDVLFSEEYQIVFPNTKIRKDNRASDQWGTTKGGKFTAAGSGTGIAGRGAHSALIDDPISEQDAFSKASRQKINDWYPGGFRTRLMPGGRIALIQTRWTEDDLSGWLIQQEFGNPFADKWTVVNIPALNTSESLPRLIDATKRMKKIGLLPPEYPHPKLGESFWPAPHAPNEYYWSTDDLLRTKNNMPSYQWNALYMQSPSDPEGGIIKVEDWKVWPEDKIPPQCDYVVMSMDTAFSVKKTADYSAISIWGIFVTEEEREDARTMYTMNVEPTQIYNMILLGAERGRWDYPTLRKKAIERYNKHNPSTVLIEKKASGQSLIQDLGMVMPIQPYNPDRDKEARAHAISSLFHNGRIWAPMDRSWAKDVVDECAAFPTGAHDDYVDTMTQAAIWLRNGSFLYQDDTLWHNRSEDDTINRPRRRFY